MKLYVEYPPSLGSSFMSVDSEYSIQPLMNILKMVYTTDGGGVAEHDIRHFGQFVLYARHVEDCISLASCAGFEVIKISIADDKPFRSMVSSSGHPVYSGTM